jgi:hypothetical protein
MVDLMEAYIAEDMEQACLLAKRLAQDKHEEK